MMPGDTRRTNRRSAYPVNFKRLFIGLTAVAFGIAVYLIERPRDAVAFMRFIPFDLGVLQRSGGFLGPLAGFLPDLAHIFGFILLTGALTPQTRTWDLIICMGWLGVEIAFEAAQGFGAEIISKLPWNFEDHPLLHQITAYLAHGTYDPMDLAAFIVGMMAAYWVLCRTRSSFSSL